VLNRVKYTQASVGTVARYEHHFNPGTTQAGVEAQQLFDQREGVAGLKDFFLVFDLVFAVGLHPLSEIDLVAVAQVEQGPRRNRQHQFVA